MAKEGEDPEIFLVVTSPSLARAYSTSRSRRDRDRDHDHNDSESRCGIPSLRGYDCGVAGKEVVKAQLKAARGHLDKARDACRGKGFGNKIKCKISQGIASTWCKNAQNLFNSKCNIRAPLPPPVYYPPAPPVYPAPVPIPYPQPYPQPIPPEYYPPPPPPVYYPPPPPIYYPPPTPNYPSDLTGNQIVRQSTTPVGVYAGRARAMRARAMRAQTRAMATRTGIRPRFSGLV